MPTPIYELSSNSDDTLPDEYFLNLKEALRVQNVRLCAEDDTVVTRHPDVVKLLEEKDKLIHDQDEALGMLIWRLYEMDALDELPSNESNQRKLSNMDIHQ